MNTKIDICKSCIFDPSECHALENEVRYDNYGNVYECPKYIKA